MKKLACISVLMFCAVLTARAQSRPHQMTNEDSITVQHVAEKTILYRDVTGDYSKHPTVFSEMMAFADTLYTRVGACFGIYPVDPDTVRDAAALKWLVGVEVAPRSPVVRLASPTAPYKIKKLTEIDAAVLETDVEHTAVDGLSISRWMLEHGYVQTGPTRMEYLLHEGDPLKIKTRILVPVAKRKSGLKLPPSKDVS